MAKRITEDDRPPDDSRVLRDLVDMLDKVMEKMEELGEEMEDLKTKVEEYGTLG